MATRSSQFDQMVNLYVLQSIHTNNPSIYNRNSVIHKHTHPHFTEGVTRPVGREGANGYGNDNRDWVRMGTGTGTKMRAAAETRTRAETGNVIER